MKAIRNVENELLASHKNDKAKHDVAHAVWKSTLDEVKTAMLKAKGNIAETAAEADLKALPPAPEAPPKPRIFSKTGTIQANIRRWARDTPCHAWINDEAGSVLAGYSMSGDQLLNTFAILTDLWSEGSCEYAVVTDDVDIRLDNHRLTLHWQVQPDVYAKLAGDERIARQGLFGRILLAKSPERGAPRTWNEIEDDNLEALHRYDNRIGQLAREALPINPETGLLEARQLVLSPEAFGLHKRFYDFCQKELMPGGKFDAVLPLAGRAPELACRIAATLAYYADDRCADIDEDTYRNACRLMLWYLSHAARMQSEAGAAQDVKGAQALLDWARGNTKLQRVKGEIWITHRDIKRLGPRSIRNNSKDLQAALDLLLTDNLMRDLEPFTVVADADGTARARKRAFAIAT